MKKYILVFISLVLLYACDERGILENSNDVSYIYFTKNATNDSTSTSFFFYPEGDISVPVAMSLSGRMFDDIVKEIRLFVQQLFQFQILLLDRNGGMKMNG